MTLSIEGSDLHAVMSAVGDVYGHPEVTKKDSSHNVNVTSTTLTTTGHFCMGEAAETAKKRSYMSALLQQSCLIPLRRTSAVHRIKWSKNHHQSDVGRFIHIAAVSIKFY